MVRLSSSKLISDLPYLRTPAPHFWNDRLKNKTCTCREGVPVCSIRGAMDRRPGFVILLNLILFFLFYFYWLTKISGIFVRNLASEKQWCRGEFISNRTNSSSITSYFSFYFLSVHFQRETKRERKEKKQKPKEQGTCPQRLQGKGRQVWKSINL